MRIQTLSSFLLIAVSAVSALTIPLAARNIAESPDSTSISAREIIDDVANNIVRSFEDEAALLVRELSDDELMERELYDELLERMFPDGLDDLDTRMNPSGTKPSRTTRKTQRAARVTASQTKGTAPTKAGRAAAWAAANQGKNAAKTKARNDQFKANWQARPENQNKKFKKNANGKAVKKTYDRQGQPGQKVFWDKNAVQSLNNLGLHGKERKSVKKFHVNVARNAMKKTGATGAKIYQLAHKETSPIDKTMHVTGKLYKGPKGDIPIPPTYTTPDGKPGTYHHMYTPSNDPNKLPTALKNAVIRNGKTLDQI